MSKTEGDALLPHIKDVWSRYVAQFGNPIPGDGEPNFEASKKKKEKVEKKNKREKQTKKDLKRVKGAVIPPHIGKPIEQKLQLSCICDCCKKLAKK